MNNFLRPVAQSSQKTHGGVKDAFELMVLLSLFVTNPVNSTVLVIKGGRGKASRPSRQVLLQNKHQNRARQSAPILALAKLRRRSRPA